MVEKFICALDTPDLDEATRIVKALAGQVTKFKIGHALVLNHGLDVMARLQDAGAQDFFLDLKMHDIPHSVALGVREAAKRGVWLLTVHTAGGRAMLEAAAEAAHSVSGRAPLVVGVSVLTSLDDETLQQELGVNRTVEEHMLHLGRLGLESGLDGVVCSSHEIVALRQGLGPKAVIVTPGIRVPGEATQDQKRVGTPAEAIRDGADYLVIGRALTSVGNPDELPARLELLSA